MSKKGPFGLWMGMTLGELGMQPDEVAPAKYRVQAVPKPHSAFESYVLQITKNCGLSWVKAIGHTVQTSAYGIELKAAFDAMREKLSATYGKCETTDVLFPDSIWNEPRDWMQSLLSRERILMAQWSTENGSSIPDSLSSIALITGVIDSDSGYIAIEYSFGNIVASEKEIADAEDDAL